MGSLFKSKLTKEIVMILIAAAIAILPPPHGLDQKAMIFLALLIWAVLNWAITVMPSYISGLILLLSSVVFQLIPFKTAFGAFSGATIWLIIGVLGIGTVVKQTGLMARLSLYILGLFPASFRGQALGLMIAGILIGPFMPSTTAKVSIAGGFGTEIAELLGFAPRSRGVNGLFASLYTGFVLLAPIFITSSFWAYLVLGLIPTGDAARFNFLSWLTTMLPWGIFTAIFSYLAIIFMYNPKDAKSLTKEDLKKMSANAGPMSRDEKITLAVLVICIVFWVLEPVLKIPAVISAMGAICVFFITGVLKPKEINSFVNWGLIIFIGCAIGLAPMVNAVGLNKWMEAGISSIIAGAGTNPYILIAIASLLVLACRFILIAGTAAITLMLVILIPVCEAAGINPWVGGIAAYAVAQPFFLKYQNPNFVIGFESAGGDEKLDFKSIVPFSFVYHIIAIAGLLVSIPYWQYLGLIH